MTGTRRMHSPFSISQVESRVQVNPFSMVQFDEHPSPSITLPTSHSSVITRPSPHAETQDCPSESGSRRHSAEPPSNGRVLPSSQASAPSTRRSPQAGGAHTLGAPAHLLPSPTRQRSEQPSPGSTLPSSHCSEGATSPSPQRAITMHGLPGSAQLKPGSSARQVAMQPSPDSMFPSSQTSSSAKMPSPQPGGIGSSIGSSTRMPPTVADCTLFTPWLVPLPPAPLVTFVAPESPGMRAGPSSVAPPLHALKQIAKQTRDRMTR